jgi:biofilm PGA synthesis N-glycosyltransferase PgaC
MTLCLTIPFFSVALWIFILATMVQLFFWGYFFARLAFFNYSRSSSSPKREATPLTSRPAPAPADQWKTGNGGPPPGEPPVSVIICARNEAENLRRNLPHFLNQNYRSFEILVVNDNSSDKTREVLLEFQRKNPKLRVLNLETETLPGKKTALTTGIEASTFDIILLSDADCMPTSEHWLQLMQSAIRQNIEIGIGYSPYRNRPGWLNRFIRFEALYTATQYLSFALAGVPYMGVGRNLAYRKSVFRRSGGFRQHLHLASGDDDLFVNQVAHRHNTNVILEPGAFVISKPKTTWRGYYYQKHRHLTTGRRFRPFHKILLGALSASHAGHYLGGLALLLSGGPVSFVYLIYLVRMGVVVWLYRRIMRRLDDLSLWPWVPILDAAFVGYYFAFAPVLITGKVKQWK